MVVFMVTCPTKTDKVRTASKISATHIRPVIVLLLSTPAMFTVLWFSILFRNPLMKSKIPDIIPFPISMFFVTAVNSFYSEFFQTYL